MKSLIAAALMLAFVGPTSAGEWVVYEGKSGPGKGKHIVFLTGDEEYRSEEGLPQLAKILAERHGFKCTVLFSLDPTGSINPDVQTNIPGMTALDSADLCIMLLRFRELPDADMKHFADYFKAGKPIIALRTSTHAFKYARSNPSPYAHYSFDSTKWPGGFGQQVLGDTWISHHGKHAVQSTRGIINDQFKSHPILRGVDDIWGPSDVYGITHLPADAKVLVRGQVLTGMKPTDPPLEGEKNEPMMPLAWVHEHKQETGKASKIFTTTMGAATDLENEGLRRLVVNACYWAVGLDKKIPAKSNVELVGEYKPTNFGFRKAKQGVKPADLELKK